MIPRSSIVVAAGALIALAAWPLFASRPTQVVRVAAPADVNRDYVRRDALIAFYEQQVRRTAEDQITRRMLAAQYLQRFREQGDVGDIARAQEMARQSLVLQPQGNTSAQMALASALLTYHDFRGALAHEQDAIDGEPFNVSARAQKASLLMELGHYELAGRILGHRPGIEENPAWDAVEARFDEETGKLARARALIARAEYFTDRLPYIPAYDRSWYHMRAGQLAFEAADIASARREYAQALDIFPDNSMALMWQAQTFRAEGKWAQSLASAMRSAEVYPLPQTLGYEADAQRALGRRADARATDALIFAEQRLFNVQGINDRLLAVYYDQRHVRLHDALLAANADYRKRGDEIYADDTLSWALAAVGRWNDARPLSVKATRLGTRDAMLWYHRGIIALHTNHLDEAKGDLRRSLILNPAFDPNDAPDARTTLSRLVKVPERNVKA